VTLGGKKVLVVRDGELAMAAFDLTKAPQLTGFSLTSKVPLHFRTSDGQTWNVFGIASGSSGPERRLPSARSYLTEWYEWVSHSPDTEIVAQVEVLSN
jgi:hypothetical protein